MNTSHLVALERRIVDRMDNLCSDQPTWQRQPVLEHELFNGFVEIIRDEIRRTDQHISSTQHDEFDTNNI